MSIVSKQHEVFRNLLEDENTKEKDRYIDLCIIWKRKLTGEVIYKAGGKWDNINKCWSTEPATRGKIIELTEPQYGPALKAAYWMQEFKAGRSRDYFSLFLFGNRAGGKTYLASVVLFSLLIDFPLMGNSSTIAWQVSPSHSQRDELDRNIKEIFPFDGEWYRYVEHPKHEYRFVNGATLVNISGDDADSLKRGRVDFLLINEAQKMKATVSSFGIGRLKDKGGFGLFTSNPPTSKKAEWIYNLYEDYKEETVKGNTYPIQFMNLDSKDNVFIDKKVSTQIDKIIRIIDPISSAADIDGLIKPIGDRAYWNWDKKIHIKEPPIATREFPDITERYTQANYGKKFPYIAGVDFQNMPYHMSVVFKIFGTMEKPVFWAVDEIKSESEESEDEFLDSFDESYTNKEVLFVGDCSGNWQDGTHKKYNQEKPSFSYFQNRKWEITTPTKKKSSTSRFPKNPPIEQRVGLINKMLGSGQFFVSEKCETLIYSFKECKLIPKRTGPGFKPDRIYSHATDACGYVVWYVVPPVGRSRGPSTMTLPKQSDDIIFQKFLERANKEQGLVHGQT